MEISKILSLIHSAAKKVHDHFGPGFLESVYSNALMIELEAMGLSARQEVAITLKYKDQPVGLFKADILVENQVILELKAVETTTVAHSAQLVNYLQASGIDHGILINFGAPSLFIIPKTRLFKR